MAAGEGAGSESETPHDGWLPPWLNSENPERYGAGSAGLADGSDLAEGLPFLERAYAALLSATKANTTPRTEKREDVWRASLTNVGFDLTEGSIILQFREGFEKMRGSYVQIALSPDAARTLAGLADAVTDLRARVDSEARKISRNE